MITVIHVRPYDRFIETQSNLRKKKLHRTNQCSNFLGRSFSNKDNVRAPIQFRRKRQSQQFKSFKQTILPYQIQKTTFPDHWVEEVWQIYLCLEQHWHSPKVPSAKFMESNRPFFLLTHASLAALRILLQRLLACLNFTLDSEDLFCWYKRKKLWAMAAAQAAKNQGDEWCLTHYSPVFRKALGFLMFSRGCRKAIPGCNGLTSYIRWGVYTSISTWTHLRNSLAAPEAPSLEISFHGTSLK